MVDPGGFQVLRRFTLLSPLFLALTFLVSLGYLGRAWLEGRATGRGFTASWDMEN